MSKKHFAALAAALSDTHASYATALAVAQVCAATNPRFKRERFLMAAGVVVPDA